MPTPPTPPSPNFQVLVRRLPGLPSRQMMQFETLEGKVLWTAPLDDRIANILNGRWSCILDAYSDGREMEILGEAPPPTLSDTPPVPPAPKKSPHTLRLTRD